MKRVLRLLFVLMLMVLALTLTTGCNAGEDITVLQDKPETTRVPTLESGMEDGTKAPAATPETSEFELPAGAEPLTILAWADLAQRLDLPLEAIQLVSLEAVEWPDASLGCPQPGNMYAQVVTLGFRVVLEARGERYEYHTDTEQMAVLCQEEAVMGQPTVPNPVESGLNSLVHSAKEDLAQRLSIKVGQIEVVEAKSVVWPDASVGCPQPGMRYRQVPQDGALIRLRAEDRVYAYHYGSTRGLFLCEQPSGVPKSTSPQIDLLATPPGSEDR